MADIFHPDDLFAEDPWASSASKPLTGSTTFGSTGSLEHNDWSTYNSNDILAGQSRVSPVVNNEINESRTVEGMTGAAPVVNEPIREPPRDTPPENESEVEEADIFKSLRSNEWAEDSVAKFNPLSYKNNDDKTLVQVKEIPEKEGLVFKHINYLVVHNIRFGSEYYVAHNNNKKTQAPAQAHPGETKVIRRYSDFAWLVEVLWKKYPFRLIPELPPKKFAIATSGDSLFLQRRRRGLQRFLYQLARHPVLSKENLVAMFLTVPNDFANWKRFANIDLNDEFEGVRVHVPLRFRLSMDNALKGLRGDTESVESENAPISARNDSVINNITQIWCESTVDHTALDFADNFEKLNANLTRLADVWSKFSLLVNRIERREVALALDQQRTAAYLDRLASLDTSVFGMDNIVQLSQSDEAQNLGIINSVLQQVAQFFLGAKKDKDKEMDNVSSGVMESFRKFQDYMAALHFLMERVTSYRSESEKQIHLLLNRVTRTNEQLARIRTNSDIKGSEVDRLVTVATQTVDQLNTLISRAILVKATFVHEYALYQKTKYVISEVLQDWFAERLKFASNREEAVQRMYDELRDMPTR